MLKGVFLGLISFWTTTLLVVVLIFTYSIISKTKQKVFKKDNNLHL